MKSGPCSIDQFLAHLKAYFTQNTLFPSILKPGIASPLVQKFTFMEDRSTEVPIPYLLFSQMKRAGRFHSLAMLAASNSCPWLAAPSPNMMLATLGLFWYLRAKARPAPTGTCAPTIPFPPQKLVDFLQQCMDPPLPLVAPVPFPNISATICLTEQPRLQAWQWMRQAPMRGSSKVRAASIPSGIASCPSQRWQKPRIFLALQRMSHWISRWRITHSSRKCLSRSARVTVVCTGMEFSGSLQQLALF